MNPLKTTYFVLHHVLFHKKCSLQHSFRLRPHPVCSQDAGLLMIRIYISRMGGRAFSYQTPLLLKHLPVQEADTLSAFKKGLKTFLFDKAYS